MLPARLLRRRVTILRPAEVTDRYGNTVLSWDTPTREETRGELQPKKVGENVVGRTLEQTDAVLYLLPTVDLRAVDRVEVDGKAYQVDGPPQLIHRLGRPHHVAANVTLREG